MAEALIGALLINSTFNLDDRKWEYKKKMGEKWINFFMSLNIHGNRKKNGEKNYSLSFSFKIIFFKFLSRLGWNGREKRKLKNYNL